MSKSKVNISDVLLKVMEEYEKGKIKKLTFNINADLINDDLESLNKQLAEANAEKAELLADAQKLVDAIIRIQHTKEFFKQWKDAMYISEIERISCAAIEEFKQKYGSKG